MIKNGDGNDGIDDNKSDDELSKCSIILSYFGQKSHGSTCEIFDDEGDDDGDGNDGIDDNKADDDIDYDKIQAMRF